MQTTYIQLSITYTNEENREEILNNITSTLKNNKNITDYEILDIDTY